MEILFVFRGWLQSNLEEIVNGVIITISSAFIIWVGVRFWQKINKPHHLNFHIESGAFLSGGLSLTIVVKNTTNIRHTVCEYKLIRPKKVRLTDQNDNLLHTDEVPAEGTLRKNIVLHFDRLKNPKLGKKIKMRLMYLPNNGQQEFRTIFLRYKVS
jgi:hypothetical protein